MAGRAANKAALQERFGLDPSPDALLFGVVGRLSGQKGLDLVLDALPVLLSLGGQLALLGTGDRWFEASFRAAAARSSARIARSSARIALASPCVSWPSLTPCVMRAF